MHETEDHERHDQEEPQQEVQDDHQHVEEGLLRRAEVPGQRRHAGEVEAVGAQDGEADEDDPEQGPQPGADGRGVGPPPPIPHGLDLGCHGRTLRFESDRCRSGRTMRMRTEADGTGNDGDGRGSAGGARAVRREADRCDRGADVGCDPVVRRVGDVPPQVDRAIGREEAQRHLAGGDQRLPLGHDERPGAAGRQGIAGPRGDELDPRGGGPADRLGPPLDGSARPAGSPSGWPVPPRSSRASRRVPAASGTPRTTNPPARTTPTARRRGLSRCRARPASRRRGARPGRQPSRSHPSADSRGAAHSKASARIRRVLSVQAQGTRVNDPFRSNHHEHRINDPTWVGPTARSRNGSAESWRAVESEGMGIDARDLVPDGRRFRNVRRVEAGGSSDRPGRPVRSANPVPGEPRRSRGPASGSAGPGHRRAPAGSKCRSRSQVNRVLRIGRSGTWQPDALRRPRAERRGDDHRQGHHRQATQHVPSGPGHVAIAPGLVEDRGRKGITRS